MGESARKLSIEPRGLHRDEAARYIGISVSKFDELVGDGRMPPPRRIDGRKVWDRRALDSAFDDLPSEAPVNEWDQALGAAHA